MQLEDFPVPVKLKLSALWASLMACYIYADFFGLFAPGRLAKMNRGIIGPLGIATPSVLVGVSILMLVPSVMICASLFLRAAPNRWLNLMLGLLYGLIIVLTMIGAPPFYLLFGTVEVILSATILWCAWTWPRSGASATM